MTNGNSISRRSPPNISLKQHVPTCLRPRSLPKLYAFVARHPRRFFRYHAGCCSFCPNPFIMSGLLSCGRIHVTMFFQCFPMALPELFNVSIPHTQHVRLLTPLKITPRWQVLEGCHCEAFRARPCDEWKPVFRSRSEAFPPHEIDDNPLLQSEAPCSVTLDLFIPGARVTDTEARAAGLGSEANVEGSDARVTSSTFSGSSSLPLLIPRAFL